MYGNSSIGSFQLFMSNFFFGFFLWAPFCEPVCGLGGSLGKRCDSLGGDRLMEFVEWDGGGSGGGGGGGGGGSGGFVGRGVVVVGT